MSNNKKKSYFKLRPTNGAVVPIGYREGNVFNLPIKAANVKGLETLAFPAPNLVPTYHFKTFKTGVKTSILDKSPDPTYAAQGIWEFKERKILLGQTFAIDSSQRLPHNALVALLKEGISYDSAERPQVAVAKIRIISSPGQSTWVNKEVWTTRTNLGQPNAQGNFNIVSSTANPRKEPVHTLGNLLVPANTEIKVLDVFVQDRFPREFYLQNNSKRNVYHRDRYMFMYASVQYTVGTTLIEGWIKGGDIEGGLINEVLGVSPIPSGNIQSDAPAHKTVSVSSTPLLKKGKVDYIKTAETLPIGLSVDILRFSEDNKFVQVLPKNSDKSVWTASGNIKPKPGGVGGHEVKPSVPPAFVRKPEQSYEKTGAKLELGDWVITTPGEAVDFVEITKVDKETRMESPQIGWVYKRYLSDGWTQDINGTHAAWNRVEIETVVAKYFGQSELVNLGGSNGKAKQLSSHAYAFLSQMIQDAKADGVNIALNSGFRTYFSQKYFKDNEDQPGFNPAYRPGFSSHQYSYSFDLNNRQSAAVYSWLKKNAWKYDILQDERSQDEKHHWSYLKGQGKKGFYTTWGTKSNEDW